MRATGRVVVGQFQIQIRATAGEKDVFRKAATIEGLTLSAWARQKMRLAALLALGEEAAVKLKMPRRAVRPAENVSHETSPPSLQARDDEITRRAVSGEGTGPGDFASDTLHKIADAAEKRYLETMPEAYKTPPPLKLEGTPGTVNRPADLGEGGSTAAPPQFEIVVGKDGPRVMKPGETVELGVVSKGEKIDGAELARRLIAAGVADEVYVHGQDASFEDEKIIATTAGAKGRCPSCGSFAVTAGECADCGAEV